MQSHPSFLGEGKSFVAYLYQLAPTRPLRLGLDVDIPRGEGLPVASILSVYI